jgi:hypothetical protein
MNELQTLAEHEGKLSSQISLVTGTVEQKYNELLRLGIFADYKSVHTKYVELAKKSSGEIGLEALKRALFLQWMAQAEPAGLTGLYEIDSDCEKKLITLLSDTLGNQPIDPELMFMIQWYYSITDWYFDQMASELGSYLKGQNTGKISLVSSDRGAMGLYWKEIAKRF